MDISFQKYFILAGFLALAVFFLRKDRVYIVPLILLFYSNINGLLDWEDFAFKGFIKFQDYGLLLAVIAILLPALSSRSPEPAYMRVARATALYNLINFFWLFYLLLFLFSLLVQGPLWSVKMARGFFYGIIVYVVYIEVMHDPIVKFQKIFRFLMWANIAFGCLYIIYNLTDLPIYPKGAYEVFVLSYLDADVRRNFSGFPTFAHFFIFFFVDQLIRGDGNLILNLAGVLILSSCVVLMLTRYTLVITVLMVAVLSLFREQNARSIGRLIAIALVFIALLPAFLLFSETYYTTILRRFDEIATHGVLGSSTARVRIAEFEQILHNVLDFNPIFGFGFVVPWGFGYPSSVFHAGSADNGYANLLGVTGFFGLTLFIALMASWLVVNRRLRALNRESLSRATFAFLLFVLAGMMNGANASYMHYFGVFMAYDLFAYAYFRNLQNASIAGGESSNASSANATRQNVTRSERFRTRIFP